MRALLLLVLVGCAGAEQTGANTGEAAQYGALLQSCVSMAQTRAQSQACRCRVSQAYHRPCDPIADGGHDASPE